MIEQSPEALAEQRIESRADSALSATPASVIDWVTQDIADFKIIQDQDLARFAAVTITENFDSPGYKQAFEELGTDLLAPVNALYERNAAIAWARDESDTLGYAFDLLEQEQVAKEWSPSEAQIQAEKDLNGYQNPQVGIESIAYEQEIQVVDMARKAMVSPEYQRALSKLQPEIAHKVAEHPVRPAADFMNATFIGKVVAITAGHIEQKVGRSPLDTVAHPRQGLTGDNVELGQLATIQYEKGRGKINNHELAREQNGLGR